MRAPFAFFAGLQVVIEIALDRTAFSYSSACKLSTYVNSFDSSWFAVKKNRLFSGVKEELLVISERTSKGLSAKKCSCSCTSFS